MIVWAIVPGLCPSRQASQQHRVIVRVIVVGMQGKRALLAEGVSLRLWLMSGVAGRPGFLAEKKSNEKRTRSAAEARRRTASALLQELKDLAALPEQGALTGDEYEKRKLLAQE